MLTDDHPEPPPAAPRPLAPHSRGCLHCGYPLADRPIGTICPECGKPDTRVCAACNASLDGLFDHDQCRSCGLPVDRALNATLLSRLSPGAMACAEGSSWLLVVALPLGFAVGSFMVFQDLLYEATLFFALPIGVTALGAWATTLIPRNTKVLSRLMLTRWLARSASLAVLVAMSGIVYGILKWRELALVMDYLIAAIGVMCLACGMHSCDLVGRTISRHRFRLKSLLHIAFATVYRNASDACALIAFTAGMFLFLADRWTGYLPFWVLANRGTWEVPFHYLYIPLVTTLPAYAWYRWLILAIRARKIRHQRRAAGAPATSQQPTPHDR